MTGYSKRIIITAGDSVGHVIPGLTLKEALEKHFYYVEFFTDEKFKNYGIEYTPEIKIINSFPYSKKPLNFIKFAYNILKSTLKVLSLFKKNPPSLVIGFGGVTTIPILLAARILKIKIILHEQNNVLGKINRFFLKNADVLATTFKDTQKLNSKFLNKVFLTGTPVRKEILMLSNFSYPTIDGNNKINILVLGGSKGDSFFAELLPEVFKLLPANLKSRVRLNQQCSNEEEMEVLQQKYNAIGVNCELSLFFKDMPHKLAPAHLVISRAGATCISELLISGKPPILIPNPDSIDNYQYYNAKFIEQNGAGWVIEQCDTDAKKISSMLNDIFLNPEVLYQKSSNAKKISSPQAVSALLNLVVVEKHT